MSTKAIREALELLDGLSGDQSRTVREHIARVTRGARSEVLAIERAAKDLDDNLAAQVFGSNGDKIEAALNLLQRIAEDAP